MNDLASRWPQLPPGTDLDSLEARVAFNLHRLGLTGRPLRDVGLSNNRAADLAQGRLVLSPSLLEAIAARAGVATGDLTKVIPEQDRASLLLAQAHQPHSLWAAVFARAKENGLSAAQLSTILSVDRRRIAEASRGLAAQSLTKAELERLASYLDMDVEALLRSVETKDR